MEPMESQASLVAVKKRTDMAAVRSLPMMKVAWGRL